MTLAATAALGRTFASGADALAELRERYTDRSATLRRALEDGRGVVGCVGNVIPTELILAAGLRPLQVAPELEHPTPLGDEFMEASNPWGARSIFERLLDGSYESLELLVLDRAQMELYYYLKEVVRIGHGSRVPPLYMFDLIQQLDAPVQAYNATQVQRFAEQLARLSGSELSEASLADAISTTNAVRAAQRELAALRQAGSLSGVDGLQVLGAGYLMAPAEYAAALSALIADPPAPEHGGRPKVTVLSSEQLYYPVLHEAIEEAGALVVSEGDWWGAAGVGGDIDPTAPPLQAITEKYFADTVSHELTPRSARDRWILEEVASDRRPDGVIFYLPPSDHGYGWDYPYLRDELDRRGVPSCMVRNEVLDAAGRREAVETTRAFVDGLARA